MNPNTSLSKRKEVCQLLSLLASAFLVGCFIVIGIVYYYGAPNTYLLKNVLISPKTLEQIAAKKYDHVSKNPFSFVFNQSEEQKRVEISLSMYKKFYFHLKNERSLKINPELTKKFEVSIPASLTIFLEEALNKKIVFQRIEFLKDDLFRVTLSKERKEFQQGEEGWAYFSSDGIYEKAQHLSLFE